MNRLHDERGQVTAMWAVLALALLVLGGLVYDGGQVLTARRDANNLARQALVAAFANRTAIIDEKAARQAISETDTE